MIEMMTHLQTGTVLQSRYIVSKALGTGGMATTYLAEDVVKGEQVALKLLSSQDEALTEAMGREFVLLTRARHPNLVDVHDFGVGRLDGERVCFYTCRYIEGGTLETFATGRPWEEVAPAIAGPIAALAFLHRHSIRHGDFKPKNILVTEEGLGVLIDLGCARPFSREKPGMLYGTLDYVAPELLNGLFSYNMSPEIAAIKADLYSVGVTLKAVIAGLDEPPPAQVLELAERLSSPDASERPADTDLLFDLLEVAESTSLDISPELYGRQGELETFRHLHVSLWDGVSSNRVVWLHGPSGVGRSRLLREMTWIAQLQGSVVEGIASEPEPLSSMLQRGSGLSTFQPGLAGMLEARIALCSSREPTVLVLDDAHRLDAEQKAFLDGLVRIAEPDDTLLLLIASKNPPPEGASAITEIKVSPLGFDEVQRWAAPHVSPRNISRLMELTGGYPSMIETILGQIASSALREDRLAELTVVASVDIALFEEQQEELKGLDETGRLTLALLSVKAGFIDSKTLDLAHVPDQALDELYRRGWIVPDGSGWKLRRAADAALLLEDLDHEILLTARGVVVEWLRHELIGASPENLPRLSAELAATLAAMGESREATELIRSVDREGGAGLRSWCRAADVLAARSPTPEILLAQAGLHCDAGNADYALHIIAGLLHTVPDDLWMFPLRLEACRSYLRLGDFTRCMRQLDRALPFARSLSEQAEVLDMRARALIQRGEYREALNSSQAGVSDDLEPRYRSRLHEDIGVAASFLGETVLAREHLGLAESLLRRNVGSSRAWVRLLSYQAINEFMAGMTTTAAKAYERALAIAEDQGLSDQIAQAALNLGTSCHQLGDWSRALHCYERGLRTAIALGTESTAIIIRWNLAQLYADIGAFEKSDSVLKQVEEDAPRSSYTLIVGAAGSLRAQLQSHAGDLDGARAGLENARQVFAGQQARREVIEVDLHNAELDLTEGNTEQALQRLKAIREVADDLDADDLRARHSLIKGRVLLAKEATDAALRELELGLRHAQGSEHRSLEGECETSLSNAFSKGDALFLATRHKERAKEIWERIATGLPANLRDLFWSHPLRKGLEERVAEPTKLRTDDDLPHITVRLLEIYKQLSSSRKTGDVLKKTLDAAIEITGAERGFLILCKEDGELEVPIARNLDRERIGKSHLKFSKSIAEGVIDSGEPVLTIDALKDDRFRTNASVHAMRLRSVISVPIRSPEAVLGALYLDNRFERGRFRENHRDLLLAFADQASIALETARLIETLEGRSAELDKERRRVEAMVRKQAKQIDQLSEDLRIRQRELEHKYDYSHIVGRSPKMSEMLSTLDRIIDTNLPVLVEGESGTGKELVARAIHFNGARKDGPFVSVNCAALSETLLESELFGHVKGAFTGAVRDRTGLFIEAEGGTLLLDELGEMPGGMQAKLLRTLQEQEVRPVGSEEVTPINVRIIAATNRHLLSEVSAGRFRQDLYYRLVVVEVTLPPLRERVEDIPLLVRHLLTELTEELHRPTQDITNAALRKLALFAWPGNVRQLRNVLSRSILLADGDIRPRDIELALNEPAPGPQAKTRNDFESEEAARILAALHAHNWNVSEVARIFGMARTTLYRKLRRYGFLRSDKSY